MPRSVEVAVTSNHSEEPTFPCVLCEENAVSEHLNVAKLKEQIERGYVKYNSKFLRRHICNDCLHQYGVLEKIKAEQRRSAEARARWSEQEARRREARERSRERIQEEIPNNRASPVQTWPKPPPPVRSNCLWSDAEQFEEDWGDALVDGNRWFEYEITQKRLLDLWRMPNHEFLESDYWHRIRAFLLDEPRAECECCGTTEDLDVERTTFFPLRLNGMPEEGVYDRYGLVVLCVRCSSPNNYWRRYDVRQARETPHPRDSAAPNQLSLFPEITDIRDRLPD